MALLTLARELKTLWPPRRLTAFLAEHHPAMIPQVQTRMHFQKALPLALIGIDELPSHSDLRPMGRALLT